MQTIFDTTPFVKKSYPIPYSQREAVDKKIDRMGTYLEPYTLVPYKSSTNLDDPFVDEMEITCTCDKTSSSMNVCLEHYTNGSARDHQISVDNKPTNLDDPFVDEMEITCTCDKTSSSMNVCLEHYTNGSARDHQISVENSKFALNNRYLESDLTEVLNDIRQYSAVAVLAGICLEPLIPLSPQNLPNSPKGVQMKRNHVPCDIFEDLLQGTYLEPYTLVPYKSSTNLDDPFVDEMEITCTCDKTSSSMNVCLEHYTNGSARDHQISVENSKFALNNRYLESDLTEVLNDIRQYSAVAVLAGICLEPLIPLSPQNLPNSPKGVQMKRNHVPCDIFEDLLQGTYLEPYTLVPYKSSTNLDDPFVDEMEITCTCDKTSSSMNVCLEHYTNGSARDHQISVDNKPTNLDDPFVDEMEITCTCDKTSSSMNPKSDCAVFIDAALNNRYLESDLTEVLNDIRQYSAVAVLAGICLEPLIPLSPQNLPNSPKGVQMKRNHVPCDIFEDLLQGTYLEPYTLVPYKSSTNLDDPFVDEMEITCTCDKTSSSMNVCLEHYTNGSARDHQISVENSKFALNNRYLESDLTEVLNDIRQYSAVAVLAGICLEPLIPLSPQNLPNSPKGVQMKRNHVPCDIFEDLLQGTYLEPYTLVPYKSSTNLDDPFVDEMEITCTCDKTSSSMNVCLEHYTNGSARDHQISVDNKPTNLDDLFVDEMEIVCTCAQATSSKRVCLEHYADRPAPEQQITVEIADTPPLPIFDSRDPIYGYFTGQDGSGLTIEDVNSSELIFALNKFQAYYKLEITKTINDETLEVMKTPKYGMTDIATSFNLKRTFWRKNPILWHFCGATNKQIKLATVAFQLWDKYANINFQQSFENPNIIISFNGSEIHINQNKDWNEELYDISKDKLSLYIALTHEIGHAIGIDHSPIYQSLMHSVYHEPISPFNAEDFELSDDDQLAVAILYEQRKIKNKSKTTTMTRKKIFTPPNSSPPAKQPEKKKKDDTHTIYVKLKINSLRF
ncbi:hypothetical protein FQA39_LY17297 [Lamprigera yunnana]|nr:hypothetical protein FQA39_LY17297 [Lamprigera yunnana]